MEDSFPYDEPSHPPPYATGNERHQILNGVYIIQRSEGLSSEQFIYDKAKLHNLLEHVFNLRPPPLTTKIDPFVMALSNESGAANGCLHGQQYGEATGDRAVVAQAVAACASAQVQPVVHGIPRQEGTLEDSSCVAHVAARPARQYSHETAVPSLAPTQGRRQPANSAPASAYLQFVRQRSQESDHGQRKGAEPPAPGETREEGPDSRGGDVSDRSIQRFGRALQRNGSSASLDSNRGLSGFQGVRTEKKKIQQAVHTSAPATVVPNPSNSSKRARSDQPSEDETDEAPSDLEELSGTPREPPILGAAGGESASVGNCNRTAMSDGSDFDGAPAEPAPQSRHKIRSPWRGPRRQASEEDEPSHPEADGPAAGSSDLPSGDPRQLDPSAVEVGAERSLQDASHDGSKAPPPSSDAALRRIFLTIRGYYQWSLPYGREEYKQRGWRCWQETELPLKPGAAEYGKCGFPGCILPEKHAGAHQLKAIEGKRKREPPKRARDLGA